jgi:hypothetical protein
VDDEQYIEPINFRDACSRAILEMILAPIHSTYGKRITIMWPVELSSLHAPGDEMLDFTRAYLLIRPPNPKKYPSLKDADIILDFVEDNLRLCTLRETKSKDGVIRHHFETKEISIANPQIHLDAIEIITKIIEAKLCEGST